MNRNQQIIDKIHQLLAELERNLGKKPGLKISQPAAKERKFIGLTGEVFALLEDGYFNERRTLGDIKEKLRAEGIKAESTALMNPMLRLVRKPVSFLRREKNEKGQFEYFKRQ